MNPCFHLLCPSTINFKFLRFVWFNFEKIKILFFYFVQVVVGYFLMATLFRMKKKPVDTSTTFINIEIFQIVLWADKFDANSYKFYQSD